MDHENGRSPANAGTSWDEKHERESITRPRSLSRVKGHPVTIVTIDEKHRIYLHEIELKNVLLNPEYRSCDVAVIAVAGAFRKGKSFLLDYFLRCIHGGGKPSWMGKEDEPLTGFSWRGGAERDTNGILLWSHPFIVRPRQSDAGNSSCTAVFLMDTQGTFDSSSTLKDCTTLFALTTMVSSVLIYNLMHNIQQDDLHHLQFFTQYAKLALDEPSASSPFQKIIFLVRDWSYPYETPYGYTGGEKLLKRRLQSTVDNPELRELHYDLSRTFDKIRCFLMPHPGLEVASSHKYDGRISAMEPDFRKNLREFVESVVKPASIVRKKINGTNIKCFELLEYFKEYSKVYQSNVLPEPRTVFMATAEANHLAALAVAKDSYHQCMESLVGVNRPYMPVPLLAENQVKCREEAVSLFNNRKKMGTQNMTNEYRSRLLSSMHGDMATYEERNRAKRLFGSLRTPVVIFAIAFAFFLLYLLLRILKLKSISRLPKAFCNLFLLLFIFWLASWSTGYCRTTRNKIDNIVDLILFKLIGQ